MFCLDKKKSSIMKRKTGLVLHNKLKNLQLKGGKLKVNESITYLIVDGCYDLRFFESFIENNSLTIVNTNYLNDEEEGKWFQLVNSLIEDICTIKPISYKLYALIPRNVIYKEDKYNSKVIDFNKYNRLK